MPPRPPVRYRRLIAQLAAGSLLGVSCATTPPERLDRYEFTEPQMGVPFRIVLYAPDKSVARRAAGAAFNRVKALNDIMSDYEEESELSRLSRTAGQGREVSVSNELWFVLAKAREMSRRSRGAFDVTVGPVVNLWRRARRVKLLPEPDVLASARKAVGWQYLSLNARTRTVRLQVEGMQLDLGGIAKGYAADEALKVLQAQGLTRALVAGGGDLVAGEPPPGKVGWRIEVASMEVTNAPPPRFVLLSNAGLATSGDVFQHVDIDGVRYSHIVDPRTGVGLTNQIQVTVIAGDGMTADALATAVSVLGADDGLKLVEETAGSAAHITRRLNGRLEILESRRFRRWQE